MSSPSEGEGGELEALTTLELSDVAGGMRWRGARESTNVEDRRPKMSLIPREPEPMMEATACFPDVPPEPVNQSFSYGHITRGTPLAGKNNR